MSWTRAPRAIGTDPGLGAQRGARQTGAWARGVPRPRAGRGVVAAVRSFAPADDGWVSTRGPGAGHGKGSRLLVGGPERRRAYLKFAVSGLSAPPQRVTLVLRSLTAGHHGRLALRAVHARPWSERTLTRRSAPRLGRTLRRHTVQGRGRMTFSLTTRVRRNGTFTFALTSRSRRTLALGSAEAARRRAPRLVITGDGVAPAPPGGRRRDVTAHLRQRDATPSRHGRRRRARACDNTPPSVSGALGRRGRRARAACRRDPS